MEATSQLPVLGCDPQAAPRELPTAQSADGPFVLGRVGFRQRVRGTEAPEALIYGVGHPFLLGFQAIPVRRHTHIYIYIHKHMRVP